MSREPLGTQSGPSREPLLRKWVPGGSQVSPPNLRGVNDFAETGRPPVVPFRGQGPCRRRVG